MLAACRAGTGRPAGTAHQLLEYVLGAGVLRKRLVESAWKQVVAPSDSCTFSKGAVALCDSTSGF